ALPVCSARACKTSKASRNACQGRFCRAEITASSSSPALDTRASLDVGNPERPERRMFRRDDPLAPTPEHFLPEFDLVRRSRSRIDRIGAGQITGAVLGSTLSFELDEPDWIPIGGERLRG